MSISSVSRICFLALTGATLSSGALAEGDHEHHHQKAHVHGEAKLQVAIDGNTAELILQSPAANLIGFEHKPKTSEQETAVAEAREWLTATPLIQTAGNNCVVLAGAIHYEHEPDSGHDEHEHEHEHEESNGSHSDFEVTQRIKCDNELEAPLTTPLMSRFSGIEHLSVDWLSAAGQGHTEVHSGENDIHLDH